MEGLQIIFAFIVFPVSAMLLMVGAGTIVNFVPSRFVARIISNRCGSNRKIWFWGVFFLSSIVLLLNVRIVGMASDAYHSISNVREIYEPINVYIGAPISVEINESKVSYKSNYFESVWIKGLYELSNPRVKADYFLDKLKSSGLNLQYGGSIDSPVKIVGTVVTGEYHDAIELRVIRDGEKVAEYNQRFRKSFLGEQSDSSLVKLLLGVMQSAPTRLLFPGPLYLRKPKPSSSPVSKFLFDVLNIVPEPETLSFSILDIDSIETQASDKVIPTGSQNLNKAGCKWRKGRVSTSRRYVKGGAVSKYNQSGQKLEGYWLDVIVENSRSARTYLQAPDVSAYRNARVHQTVCEENVVNLLVGFSGVGLSVSEWRSRFIQVQNQKSARTPEEKAARNAEGKRVRSANQKIIDQAYREAWILSYSYSGQLLEAFKFNLPINFPQHVEHVSRLTVGGWEFSGYDTENRNLNGKSQRFRVKDYKVVLRSSLVPEVR